MDRRKSNELYGRKVSTMKIDWKLLWESTKEPLRWLVLAIVSYFLTVVAQLPYAWAILATVILRIIDGYLHGQAPEGEAGGLTRF